MYRFHSPIVLNSVHIFCVVHVPLCLFLRMLSLAYFGTLSTLLACKLVFVTVVEYNM